MMMNIDHIETPNRVMSPFQYFGGKGMLVKRIMNFIPISKIYVEPFAGAASIFWHKTPSPVEVLNDLNGDIVNLFRVLQDKVLFDDFQHRIQFTLYAREEFRKALATQGDDPVEKAWAFFVRQNQGFGGIGTHWGRVFTTNRGMAEVANSWRSRMKLLQFWHDRLTRVQIDNIDAVECIRYWSKTGDVLFYLDPPYIHSTRKSSNDYECEMNDEQHRNLVETIVSDTRSMFILSGYDNDIYEPLVDAGWRTEKIHTFVHAANNRLSQQNGKRNETLRRTETVYISPNAVRQSELF